jgi:hypothetical protein
MCAPPAVLTPRPTDQPLLPMASGAASSRDQAPELFAQSFESGRVQYQVEGVEIVAWRQPPHEEPQQHTANPTGHHLRTRIPDARRPRRWRPIIGTSHLSRPSPRLDAVLAEGSSYGDELPRMRDGLRDPRRGAPQALTRANVTANSTAPILRGSTPIYEKSRRSVSRYRVAAPDC